MKLNSLSDQKAYICLFNHLPFNQRWLLQATLHMHKIEIMEMAFHFFLLPRNKWAQLLEREKASLDLQSDLASYRLSHSHSNEEYAALQQHRDLLRKVSTPSVPRH